ncbi:hypothetical protein MLD38_020167 [Melastoma candidum]|uniref:Uncharacterized protein n=1 Tax=Melastoma candidum TaxID=119954 RepID=A0ACB9QD11_9MYRT|nr:hypothetical protein MLD38_020167 [Melastoma candidum]
MTARIRNPVVSEIQIFLRIWTILATAVYYCVRSRGDRTCRFFVYANGIACGLLVLSLIVALALYRRGTRACHCFFLATLDLVVMSLVIAGFAVAAAVGYIGKYGESHIGWMSICDNVAIFCRRVTTSVAASFIAFLLLKVIAIMSVFRL